MCTTIAEKKGTEMETAMRKPWRWRSSVRNTTDERRLGPLTIGQSPAAGKPQASDVDPFFQLQTTKRAAMEDRR
jgi:hypothetical protein